MNNFSLHIRNGQSGKEKTTKKIMKNTLHIYAHNRTKKYNKSPSQHRCKNVSIL